MPDRDAVLWGLVGALTFLVLAQGYRLATDSGPTLLVLLPIGAVVFGATTVAADRLATRMRRV